MGALRHLLRVSRPRFWLYLAGPVLVGASFGAHNTADLRSGYAIALFAYFLVPANVVLYGVNDIFDAPLDALNPKKEARETRYTGGLLVPAAAIACALLGLVLIAASPAASRLWLAGFFALAIGYSAPPLRLKTKPVLDSLSNGLYVLPGVAAYGALAGHAPPGAVVAGAWLWTMAMHTFSAVPDIEPDRAAGANTTATLLGERGSLAYCALCWLLAAACFHSAQPVLGLPMAVYPGAVGLIVGARIPMSRAYWWFPAINSVVGMVLTLGGLSRLV